MWPSTAPAAAPTAASSPTLAGDQHRHHALQRIEQQGGGRQPLAAGAQHVGRADIARADLADVAQPRGAGQQQAERDRAQQVAQQERSQQKDQASRPSRRLRAHDLAVGRVDIGGGRRSDQLGGDLLAGLDRTPARDSPSSTGRPAFMKVHSRLGVDGRRRVGGERHRDLPVARIAVGQVGGAQASPAAAASTNRGSGRAPVRRICGCGLGRSASGGR